MIKKFDVSFTIETGMSKDELLQVIRNHIQCDNLKVNINEDFFKLSEIEKGATCNKKYEIGSCRKSIVNCISCIHYYYVGGDK